MWVPVAEQGIAFHEHVRRGKEQRAVESRVSSAGLPVDLSKREEGIGAEISPYKRRRDTISARQMSQLQTQIKPSGVS